MQSRFHQGLACRNDHADSRSARMSRNDTATRRSVVDHGLLLNCSADRITLTVLRNMLVDQSVSAFDSMVAVLLLDKQGPPLDLSGQIPDLQDIGGYSVPG